MENVLVSVIITTYKRDLDTLARAINSVLNQTEKNIELIVVNDYPPFADEIRGMLKNYNDIVFINHEINMGACRARNDGIKAARGKYIALLDDDDEWFSDKIELQVKEIEKTNCDMVYCNGMYIWPGGKDSVSPFIYDPGEKKLQTLLKGNYLGGCSFPLIKKAIIDVIGGFDEEFPSSQDYDFWIRILQNGKVTYLDKPLVKYYIEPVSISSSMNKRLAGYYLLLKKHHSLFKKYPKEMAAFYKNIAENTFRNIMLGETLKVIIKSFECFPYNWRVIIAPFGIGINVIKRKIKKK